MSVRTNAAPGRERRQQQRTTSKVDSVTPIWRSLSLRTKDAIDEPEDSSAQTDDRPKRRTRFEPIWDWELDSEPDQQWLADRVLPEGGFGVLFGQSGSYKTFIALDLAYRVALGYSWGGRAVKQGAALYIAAEGSIGGLKKRARAWRAENGVSAAPVAFLPHAIILGSSDDADVEKLIALIDAMDPRPVLVIVDTIARCMDGDENNNRDMGAYVRAADRIREETGAFLLHLHHTTKKDPFTERGASALRGAADTMLQVARRGNRVVLSCDKQRDDDDDFACSVEFRSVASERSGAIRLVPTEKVSTERRLPELAQRAYDNIARAAGPVTFGEWCDRLKLNNTERKNFGRSVRALADAGKVERHGEGRSAVYTVITVNSPSRRRTDGNGDDGTPSSSTPSPLKGCDGDDGKRRVRSHRRRKQPENRPVVAVQ